MNENKKIVQKSHWNGADIQKYQKSNQKVQILVHKPNYIAIKLGWIYQKFVNNDKI